jgi:hypothetical protein
VRHADDSGDLAATSATSAVGRKAGDDQGGEGDRHQQHQGTLPDTALGEGRR